MEMLSNCFMLDSFSLHHVSFLERMKRGEVEFKERSHTKNSSEKSLLNCIFIIVTSLIDWG